MTVSGLSEWIMSWKGISAGLVLLLGAIGADGRATAQRLNDHEQQEMALWSAQAERDSVQDEVNKEVLFTVKSLALKECLKETNAIARIVLSCGEREREAGMPPR